jgi:excisionase family DNA binding protein
VSTKTVFAGPYIEPPLLFDVRQMARSLSCTLGQARYLLKTGQIPFIQLGKKFLVDPVDLRTFIERKKAMPVHFVNKSPRIDRPASESLGAD